ARGTLNSTEASGKARKKYVYATPAPRMPARIQIRRTLASFLSSRSSGKHASHGAGTSEPSFLMPRVIASADMFASSAGFSLWVFVLARTKHHRLKPALLVRDINKKCP